MQYLAKSDTESSQAADALGETWRALCAMRDMQLADSGEVRRLLEAARWSERLGEVTEASRLYLRAATLAPRDMESYLALTRLLCAHALHVEATEFLRGAIERIPDRAELWCALAQVMAEMDDRENAGAFVDEALRISPGYASARILRGALSSPPEAAIPTPRQPDQPANLPRAVDAEIQALLDRHPHWSIEHLADVLAAHYLDLAHLQGLRDLPSPQPRLPRGASATQTGDILAAFGRAAIESGDLACAGELLLATGSAVEDAPMRARLHDPAAVIDSAPNPETMFAFYDLEKGPLTYDFIHYLALAEKFRAVSGRRRLCVVIVPGRQNGFRNESPRDRFMNDARKAWRLNHVLMPSCHLVPSSVGALRLRTREDARALLARLAPDAVFPVGYAVDEPICPYMLPILLQFAAAGPDIRSFRAPRMAAGLVRRLFRDRAGGARIVSITLRDSDFQPQRNSRVDDWLRIAELCRARGLFPVFVPDSEALLRGAATQLENFATLPLAAMSVAFRAAVYEESWLNLMTSNGPYALALYNARAHFSMFKLVVPEIPTATESFLRSQGIVPGAQLPFAGPDQRFVWSDDGFDEIAREIDRVASL